VYDVPSDSEEDEFEKLPADYKDYSSEIDSVSSTSLFEYESFQRELDFGYWSDEEYYEKPPVFPLLNQVRYIIDQQLKYISDRKTDYKTSESGLRYFVEEGNKFMLQYVAMKCFNGKNRYKKITVELKPHSYETRLEIIAPGWRLLIETIFICDFVVAFDNGKFLTLDQLASWLLRHCEAVFFATKERRRLAIAMATHPRLGAESWLGAIDPAILETIAMLV
jgi:hypothetical protein